MAEKKVRLTDLPQTNQLLDNAVVLINQNDVDFQAPIKKFLRADNNLSDVDAVTGRSNLGVYSKEDVDGQIQETVIPYVDTAVSNALGNVSPDKIGAKKAADVDGLTSFSTLRNRKPAKEGERVYLVSHALSYNQIPYGGGWFIGHLGSGYADDGGYCATGDGFYWVRDKSIDKLDVTDWGAIPDGASDAGPAAQAMYEFMFGLVQNSVAKPKLSNIVAVRFPAGKFFVSPRDWTKYGTKLASNAPDLGQNPSGYKAANFLAILGAPNSDFGKMIGTTIVSNKTTNAVFHVNHRYLIVDGIIWDGQQTNKASTDTRLMANSTQGVFNEGCSNKQPFLDNDCPAGTFARIRRYDARNTGNYGIRLRDTLDSKFDQIYGSNFCGPVLIAGWSDPLNQWTGKWDHSTAIELTNFNFQSNWCPAFWFPRVGQGLISNGWVEHGNVPYDINNGQWVIDALSVEDCKAVVGGSLVSANGPMWNSRNAGIRQFSGPTGNALDFDTTPNGGSWLSYPKNPDGSDITAWQGGYETGYSRLEAAFSLFNHPVMMEWQRGFLRGYTDSQTRWVRIGVINSQSNGGQWKVRIKCKNGLSGQPANMRPINDGSAGETTISVARTGGSNPVVTMSHTGYTGVRSGQYYANGNTQVTLYAEIASYTEYDIILEHTGLTRAETGQPSIFSPSNAFVNWPNQKNIIQQFSLHNNTAGIGAYDRAIAIDSQAVDAADADMSGPVGLVRVKLNGVDYAMPAYGIRPVISAQSSGQNVTVGSAINLSVTASDAFKYQWMKDGAAIDGATAATYTKSNAQTTDSGSYTVVVTGAGPTGLTATSAAMAVKVA